MCFVTAGDEKPFEKYISTHPSIFLEIVTPCNVFEKSWFAAAY